MLDALVASEGEPDLVQLSGGEPTIHPEFFAILDAAQRRPIRHVMINTNGIRIAQDPEFVERWPSYTPRLRGLSAVRLAERRRLDGAARRGADARSAARRWRRSRRRDISTTLVCAVKRGVNDDEIADIVRHALTWNCVRGVTFQPVQDAGRNEGFDPKANRIVLTEIRRARSASPACSRSRT